MAAAGAMQGDRQASWVLELLLLEPVEDGIANIVFHALSFSLPLHPRLRKIILLRRISSDLSRRTVTENTLSSLELIEELLRADGGAKLSDSLKSAYAAVSVHLTAAVALTGDGRKFDDVVERIWRRRVGDLRRSEAAAGLVSNSLENSMKEMEDAILDQKVRGKMLEKDTLEEALVAVGLFMWEALNSLGPSFLDLVKNGTESEDARREVFNHPFAKILATENVNKLSDDVDMEKDSAKGDNARDHSLYPGNVGVCGTDGNTGVCPPAGSSVRDFNILPSPEVQRVKEALIKSCADLQAVVRDPLPDAINAVLAENRLHDMRVPNRAMLEADEVVCNSSPEDITSSIEAAQNTKFAPRSSACPTNPKLAEEETAADQDINASPSLREKGLDIGCKPVENHRVQPEIERDKRTVRQTSLMDRNPTACTYEWESLDSSSDKAKNSPKRLRLHKQKGKMFSPVANDVRIKNVPGRRKVKRWTVLEEDTLREGVARYGMGKWKDILNSYTDIFVERTQVDLKDKWRNMAK